MVSSVSSQKPKDLALALAGPFSSCPSFIGKVKGLHSETTAYVCFCYVVATHHPRGSQMKLTVGRSTPGTPNEAVWASEPAAVATLRPASSAAQRSITEHDGARRSTTEHNDTMQLGLPGRRPPSSELLLRMERTRATAPGKGNSQRTT